MSAVTNSPVTPSRKAFHNGDVCFAAGVQGRALIP